MMQVACNSASVERVLEGVIRSAFSFGSNWMICVYTEHTGLREERDGHGSVALAAVCLVSRDSRSAYSFGSCMLHLNESRNAQRRETKGAKLAARRGMHGHNREDHTLLL